MRLSDWWGTIHMPLERRLSSGFEYQDWVMMSEMLYEMYWLSAERLVKLDTQEKV